MSKTTVYNLSNGDISEFLLESEEALISAYLLDTGKASFLIDIEIRDAARSMIVKGSKSLSLGDFACLTNASEPNI